MRNKMTAWGKALIYMLRRPFGTECLILIVNPPINRWAIIKLSLRDDKN